MKTYENIADAALLRVFKNQEESLALLKRILALKGGQP